MKFSLDERKSNRLGPTVALVAGVHGDEKINLGILDYFEKVVLKKGTLRLIIANVEAVEQNKRFVVTDLNRVFPGKEGGVGEAKLAYDLMPVLRECNYLLDFHAFGEESPEFSILVDQTPNRIDLAKICGIKRNVIMPGKGLSLVEQAKCGLGIELGLKSDINNIKRGVEVAERLLKHLKMLKVSVEGNIDQHFYLCRQKFAIPKGFRQTKKISNFVEVKKGELIGTIGDDEVRADSDFFPVLYGSAGLGEGFLCRTAKEVTY